MNSMYAIETNKLTKVFSGYKAVDELSLKVPEGAVYGFLGPNGAGKTTTIKMLTGLSQPTSGDIKILGGKVRFGNLKGRQEIGFLPDVPNFYDWMNAREFLTFTGELFSIDRASLKKRVEELLELVGLQGVNKKVRGYSRGMKQRLGIAQALINNPKIIFLDEPTSALDPIGRKEVMDIISTLQGKVTVFFSTHILADIERVCDTVVILDKGRMVVEDAIANLREKFLIRSIELEIDANGGFQDFIDVLGQQKWVGNLALGDKDEIKLRVTDMRKAQMEIPGILNEKKVALRKFAVLEPTLEDIFLKVVDKQ